jgi:hypothetical protein
MSKYDKESWEPHSEFDIAYWDGYLKVQASGLTNMWDSDQVVNLAWELADVDMDRDDVVYIIKNYTNLRDYFGYGMEKWTT